MEVLYIMSNIQPLIDVFGFVFVLTLFPSPIPFFPIVGALLYPADISTGAFVGMVAGLLYGTVNILMRAVLSFAIPNN